MELYSCYGGAGLFLLSASRMTSKLNIVIIVHLMMMMMKQNIFRNIKFM